MLPDTNNNFLSYDYCFSSGIMAESVCEEPAHSRVIRRNLTELCERISIIGLYEKLLEKGALSRVEVNRIKVGLYKKLLEKGALSRLYEKLM